MFRPLAILAAVAMLASGCASSTANYPLKPHVMNKTLWTACRKDGLVFYYRQAAQTPREAYLVGGGVKPLGLAEDVAKGALKGITEAFPKVAKEYAAVRTSNGFSNAEIFVRAQTPEQMEAARKMLEAIGRKSE